MGDDPSFMTDHMTFEFSLASYLASSPSIREITNKAEGVAIHQHLTFSCNIPKSNIHKFW